MSKSHRIKPSRRTRENLRVQRFRSVLRSQLPKALADVADAIRLCTMQTEWAVVMGQVRAIEHRILLFRAERSDAITSAGQRHFA